MIKLYTNRQSIIIAPFLKESKKVLDFGCGDLSLIRGLHELCPNISFIGVDVVDSGVRIPGVRYTLYNGTKLPFANTSFDTTVVYHVFHHCDHPKKNLADVLRVTKKRMIMVEPVVRWRWELLLMKLADRLSNGWRNVAIPMPFQFQTQKTWETWIKEMGWKIETEKSVGVLPAFLPIGETVLFSLVPAR